MSTARATPRFTIGVSLKMYFTHTRTIEWSTAVGELAKRHPAVRSGLVELFVVPSFPALVPVRDALDGAPVRLGAQDLASADSGAFTGEVSGVELAEIGCTLAEIGHAERRRLFFEDDAVISAKTAAALRNGITPLLCVGEIEQAPAAVAALEVTQQIDAALAASAAAGLTGPLLVAYEPVWAIGAPEPAAAEHIVAVVRAIGAHLESLPAHTGSRVVYGGSAGPGLLTTLGGEVDGLFLGRFAHDVSAVESILDEALALGEGAPA
ncbi:triose-phosphate isomerase family protein [Frigoribacterium sp. CFBP9030]|uniref:triose-phosphate isomerase family protein n=1 Tax=Frigoribacterium sp. CFBP9030 TaxID=3096537 RepID=UPI002A69A2BA|nr:triose-phosphate isomerase family protein [Frigoribacterium sp. CFBP9030]MDY0892680.1 triose-phosphate isomerase family protein [Frigoribacterium sp. CFBP9030]